MENISIEELQNKKIIDFQEENPDIKGWIKIENTNINYPLLQTTNNEYYLNHNYKKETSKIGAIFINNNSNLKNNNSNIIIYGHYIKSGEMFADLIKYKDKDFYNQHSIIEITTKETIAKYKIIYVFKSRIFYQNEQDVFKYYNNYNFENEKQYNEYLENCQKLQLYDTKVNAIYGEQLLTLVTCEYSQKNGRMIIVAKRIE